MFLAGLVDPLEGFPLILGGGLLAVTAAALAKSRWLRLEAWGFGIAAAGAAAMVVVSMKGGVGGETGLPAAWAIAVLPYPIGALLLLGGTILLALELFGGRKSGDIVAVRQDNLGDDSD